MAAPPSTQTHGGEVGLDRLEAVAIGVGGVHGHGDSLQLRAGGQKREGEGQGESQTESKSDRGRIRAAPAELLAPRTSLLLPPLTQHAHGSSSCCLTSLTTTSRPPVTSSMAGSILAQNMCWWCWALTPGPTKVPQAGLGPSPGLSLLVESSPVSLISCGCGCVQEDGREGGWKEQGERRGELISSACERQFYALTMVMAPSWYRCTPIEYS